MARGRFLAKTIAIDKKLNSMSFEAEGLYLKTIPHLDRDGLILYGEGHELWAQVCPRRIELLQKVPQLVNEWTDCGLVTIYDTEEGMILFFYGFHKNQKGRVYSREAPSRFDAPPGFEYTKSGLTQANENDDTSARAGEVASKSRPNRDDSGRKSKSKSKINLKSNGKNANTKMAEDDANSYQKTRAYFERYYGQQTKDIADLLHEAANVLGDDTAMEALKIAYENVDVKSKWPYAKKILKDWIANGKPTDRHQTTTAPIFEGLEA